MIQVAPTLGLELIDFITFKRMTDATARVCNRLDVDCLSPVQGGGVGQAPQASASSPRTTSAASELVKYVRRSLQYVYPMKRLLTLLCAGLCACGEVPEATAPGWTPGVCQDGVSCCAPEELVCTGDPDRGTVCTCFRSWTCDGVWSPTSCEQELQSPDGGSGWTCTQDGEFETCTRSGSAPPQGGGSWTCTVEADEVVCRRPASTPDGSSGWSCTYTGGLKQCRRIPTPSVPGPVPPTMSAASGCTKSQDPPDILVALDRSGSMASLSGGSSKWSQATGAVSALVSTFAGEVRFGLTLFSSSSGSCYAGAVDVPVGDNTTSAIATSLGSTAPTGGTPIASTLQAALTYLQGVDPKKTKLVLLVTDGGESCGGDPVAAVKALLAAQIKTYVVGFGSEVDAMLLDDMAQAGGTATGAGVGYYQADDQTQLVKALESVAGEACK